MKLRSTIYSLSFLALMTLAACHKTEEVVPAPTPVDKTVVFEVFGDQDFSYSRYGEEEVTIQLLISRKNNTLPEAVETTVFDSTFTMALKDLPVRANRMSVRKTVPGVTDGTESIFIGSGYRYRQESFGKNQTFPAEQVVKTVQLTVY